MTERTSGGGARPPTAAVPGGSPALVAWTDGRRVRDDARTATLRLLTPGGAPASTVARGGAVSAAVAYPNDALGF